ncbi:hypothetical protein HJD18_16850 [Thermoleophilia bacterium SCSIO 60948]|nr:hypothetical protein HJD18_16850 [Thermoleophilia bacterium SCSIO 60948]
MRRLLPDPADTTPLDLVAGLDLAAGATDTRPYVISNFALTVDGRSTLGGTSATIGSEVDTQMLVALRTAADAILIGAGTMRAERYGNLMGDPAKRELRQRAGRSPVPMLAIVSGGLELPWDAPAFTESDGGGVVIFTSSDEQVPGTTAPVEVVRTPAGVELSAVLEHLRREHDVRSLLCEGGAGTHGGLIEGGLIDELFVTTGPVLGGGSGPGLVSGISERNRRLELAWLCEHDGDLFHRYRVLR